MMNNTVSAVNVSTIGGLSEDTATTSLPTMKYPDIILESLNTPNTLEFLAPLIVILLSTLLAIIILFSCVLCTCATSNTKATVNIRIDTTHENSTHNERITLYKYHQYHSLPLLDEQKKSWYTADRNWETLYGAATDFHSVSMIRDKYSSSSVTMEEARKDCALTRSECILDRVTVL